MNFTTHALERYCQRVMGMPEIDSKTYAKSRKSEVEKLVDKMVDESIWFWRGSYNGTFTDADYHYHKNGYVIIIEKSVVITIYKLDFGFDEEIDKKIAKDLFGKVNKLRQKNEKIVTETQNKISQKEIDIENIQNQIELLQMQKNKALSEKDLLLKEIEFKQKDLDDTALKLINSLQFRMELIALKGKKVS